MCSDVGRMCSEMQANDAFIAADIFWWPAVYSWADNDWSEDITTWSGCGLLLKGGNTSRTARFTTDVRTSEDQFSAAPLSVPQIFIIIIIIIIIIIYLSWSWASCWPLLVSRIQKSLQRSTMIPSASWAVDLVLIYFHKCRN